MYNTEKIAYPWIYSDLIPRFGRPVPELSMISNLVMDTIYQEHNHRITQWKTHSCYTSQLKYVFRLEENVSRAMGQNSLTP